METRNSNPAMGNSGTLWIWRGSINFLSPVFMDVGCVSGWGASVGAVLPWRLVPGAYIWIVLALSGCSMFLLARRWFTTRDAVFAAVLYAANPYHLVIVYWRSAFAELLASALLPVLLLSIVRLEGSVRKSVIPLGLIIAAGWFTNVPAAVMVNYSLALLVAAFA